MRFSSLVSLLVVTASFALGGCAADAEQASSEATGQGQSALVGSARAHQTFENKGTTAESAAFAAEAARTRVVDINSGETVAVGRTGMVVGRGANGEFTNTVDIDDGPAAGIDRAARAQLVDEGFAVNPAQLAEINPAFGAHLPGSQQLSRSGEAHQDTATSRAKRDP